VSKNIPQCDSGLGSHRGTRTVSVEGGLDINLTFLVLKKRKKKKKKLSNSLKSYVIFLLKKEWSNFLGGWS
jgi:hypothetical protein